MTHDPVTKKQLDTRYEWPVFDGPSWERLCDALKYTNVREMGVEFTWVIHDGKTRRVMGRVCGIEGSPHSTDANPTVKFIPTYDCSTNPVPLEISYWPNHRKGHAVNVAMRKIFTRTLSASPVTT